MNVLLSIRPKYIEEMAKGNKRYEFRKSIFKKNVDKVWIYATSPTKKIVGTFVIGEILKDTPDNLWEKFNGTIEFSSDISRNHFPNFKIL